MEQKMVVLKPLAWNSSGYIRPEGIETRAGGFVGKHGFGAEEWNGNPHRMWEGQRVFYTVPARKLTEHGMLGELGIIMTAYNAGVAYALGIATSVRTNTQDDMHKIALALKVSEEAETVWNLPSVKRRHPNWVEFKKFWAEESQFITWRCPPAEFSWFTMPVRLNPSDLFPPSTPMGKSPDIIKMHRAYQAIRPDQAISVVRNSLDTDSPIMTWLSTGHFYQSVISEKTKRFGTPSPSVSGRSAPPPSDPYVRYIQKFEIQVSPRHSHLQNWFKVHIESAGATSITCDQHGVDIQFKLSGHGRVLAEIKPCEIADARFAVRTAMGQLLDYRQRHLDQQAALLVVLETRPSDEDIDLALSNGFGVAYPRGANFVLRWQ
jgi:hypothetical protein